MDERTYFYRVMGMNYIIYYNKLYVTRFSSEWSDSILEPIPPTWAWWTGTNLLRINLIVDRILDRECDNEREGEEQVCCNDCCGGLAGILRKTVLLESGYGVGCCENVIWHWRKNSWEDMIEVLRVLKCALSQSSLVKMSAQLVFQKCVVSGLRNPLAGIHRKSFIGDWDVWGILLSLFWPNCSMRGCCCRRWWVRQYLSCLDRPLSVWGKCCLWRIHFSSWFNILQILGRWGVDRELSRREGLCIEW